MRAIFGVMSLLIALAVVGVLAKKQLGALPAAPVPVQLPTSAGSAVTAHVTPQAQSQQLQQQIKQSVEKAMQQARPMPDDQ